MFNQYKKTLAKTVLSVLGEDATLTTAGVTYPIRVKIDRDVEIISEHGTIATKRVVATFLTLDDVTPTRGDAISNGDESWVLDEQVAGDQNKVRWFLR